MIVPFKICDMRRLCLLLLLCLLAAPASAAARTVLVVGDSLSAAFGMDLREGWVALLAARLAQQQPGYRVVNASVSGDTTANGLARLPRLLAEHRPAIVIIELGGNDGLRGLAPDQMKNNIRAMIAKSKAQGARVLLLGVELPPNYGPKYNERFRRVYKDLAAEQQVPLVPSVMDGVGTDIKLMQADRIHPNAAAQSRMLENVWPALRVLL
jgi:acyl-CoA thioesterase-1